MQLHQGIEGFGQIGRSPSEVVIGDFSRVQRTAEAYGPNLGPDGKPAVREQAMLSITQGGMDRALNLLRG